MNGVNKIITNDSGQYRSDIDGLRAIAITAVIAFHAGVKAIPGGFVGVDIFFVLSGFLITSMLFKEAELTGKINLQEFYARRIRRLLPASSLVLVVSVILAYFVLIPIGDEQLKFARSVAAAVFFVSNIYFWNSSGGYFDGPSDQIALLHTWSLSVEEQFYIVWPLLLIGILHVVAKRHWKLRTLVISTLLVMFIISLGTSIWLSHISPSAGFYLLPARIWELTAGALTGILINHQSAWQDRLSNKLLATTLSVTGLLAIGVSVLYFDERMAFPGWIALIPVLGTVALVTSGQISRDNSVSKFLSTPPMVWIGKLSYSWYLWHWSLLVFVKINNFGQSNLVTNGLIVLLALFLAFLTYYFIENPIRHKKPWLFATTKGTLKAGAGLIGIVFLATLGLLGLRSYNVSSTTVAQQIKFAHSDFSQLRFACSRDGAKPLEALYKSECEMGNKSAKETIVVWGDSHSDHWIPLIVDYFANYKIVQYSMPGCPPLINNVSPNVKNCREFNDLVAESIKRNTSVKGVVLAARWPIYSGSSAIQNKQKSDFPLYFDASATSSNEALKFLDNSLNKMLTDFSASGIKVLVLAPTPEFEHPIINCMYRKSTESCLSTRKENDAYRDSVVRVLKQVVAKHSNTRLSSGYEALCDEMHCKVMDNDRILFSDGDHLTGSGAKYALKSMRHEFEWFVQK